MATRTARLLVLATALVAPVATTVAVVPAGVASAATSPPSSISVTGTARDFEYGSGAPVCSHAVNPDFQSGTLHSDDHGIATTSLGADGTPGYAGPTTGTNASTGPSSFAQWYHDVPGTNIPIPVTIRLDRDATTGVYSYSNPLFFPIDGQGWSNAANCPSPIPSTFPQTDAAQYIDSTGQTLNESPAVAHNFSFTFQIHTTFTYKGGETFDFAGDDDVWVYMNGHKVLDLGGLHPRESGSVTLNDVATAAGMQTGGTYAFDLFFAERHTTASSFLMSTTLDLSPLAISGLSAQSVSATTPPAVTSVDINNIPAADLPATAADGVASAPLRSVPLRSVGVTDSPLRSVPLRSVPLRSVPLRSVPLRSVLLSQVPLIGTTWAQVLGEDVPLQTTTLDDALNRLDVTGAAGPTMDQVDLSDTPLNMSVASVFLGSTALSQLPIMPPPSGDTGSNFGNWCGWFQSLGYSCSSLGIGTTSPLLAADLSGVPLRSVPLRSVPLRSVPVGAPLRSVPLRSVDIANSPLRSVPLRSVQLVTSSGAKTAFGAIPLSAVSPDSGIARTSINPSLTALVTCPTTCGTLADAINANATGTSTLSDLAALIAGSTLTLGDLAPLTSAITLTVGDLADNLTDDSVSLADVLMALLPPSAVPWESIPLTGLNLARYADPHVTYFAINAHLSGGLDTASGHISFDMPAGFHFAGVTGNFPDGANVDGRAVGNTVTLTLTGFPVPSTVNVQVGLAPAETLGVYSLANLAAAFTSTNDGSASASGSETDAGVHVTDPDPGVEFPSSIQTDHLVFGWISQPGEVNTYRLPVPAAGTRIHVLLSHLPTDDDLVMYGQLNASSPSAAPLRSVPLRSVPLLDTSIGTSSATGSATPQVLNDVPLRTDRPVIGESARSGTGDEEVDTLSTGPVDGGDGLLIQVTGYNGASSDQPYVLRVVEDTPQTTTCPNLGGQPQQVIGSVLPSISGLPAPSSQTKSLFLVNSQQLAAAYPATDVTTLVSAVQSFVQRRDVDGAVLPVDSDSAVVAAYNAWNADPCDTTAANNVVYAIHALVQREVGGPGAPAPHVTSVVLLGADNQLPMFRLPDLTFSTNEIGYAESDTGSNGNNPLSASQRHEDMLTDDVYGSLHPVSWLQNPLFVPDLAVGRLVETPSEITAQLNQFSTAGGRLTPSSSLTTGYDFLADGAHAVDNAVTANGAVPHTTLIDNPGSTTPPWTHAQLDAALFPSGGAQSPYLDSINAHFDHNRALPSAGNATGSQADLFTVSDITANTGRLVGRLLFSMGCHAGLNVPDGYLGSNPTTADVAMAKDWAQTFADENAVWVANTGFGLGDTDTVALSEELMHQFALRLNGSMTAGQALQLAKQAYFGELGAYGVYDEKALQEPVFYGLPMWRVGGAAVDANTVPAAPSAAAPDLLTSTDAHATTSAPSTSGGVTSADISIAPTFTQTAAPSGRGTFWSVGGETQVTHYRPIEPRTSVLVRPDPGGGVPHGAWITALTSHDNTNINPVYARPTIDLSGNEPEASIADTTFPTQFEQLSAHQLADGTLSNRLVMLPGQFFAYAGSTRGTQRLFDNMTSRVFYASSTASYDAPTITRAQASYANGSVTFTLDATAHDGATLAAAKVLYHDSTGWHGVDLDGPIGNEFSKTVAVSSSTIEWFGQVRDSNSNVAVSDDKGQFFGVQSQFASTTVGDQGTNNWYVHQLPTVDATGPASRYTVVVDGVALGLVPQTIGEGTHSVRIRGNDGTTHDLGTIKVDVTTPTAALSPPNFTLNGNGAYSVVCSDNASGVTDCPGGGSVNTAALGGGSIGPLTIHDAAGNASTVTLSYAVQAQPFFFLQPVNDPWGGTTGVQMSAFKAGSTIPLKFQFKNAQGGLVADSAAQSIVSACGARLSFGNAPATSTPVSETTITTQPDNGGCFRYDSTAHQFIYNLGTKPPAFSPGNWALRVVVTVSVANTPYVVGDHVVVVGLR